MASQYLSQGSSYRPQPVPAYDPTGGTSSSSGAANAYNEAPSNGGAAGNGYYFNGVPLGMNQDMLNMGLSAGTILILIFNFVSIDM